MAEKKAVEKKDKPMKGSKVADEGNAFGKAEQDAVKSGKKEFEVGGKTYPVKEASDFTRMQDQLARLNRSETATKINENSEVNRIRALANLLKG
jgi:hypothetical protein